MIHLAIKQCSSLKENIFGVLRKLKLFLEAVVEFINGLIYFFILGAGVIAILSISAALSQSTKVALDIANISITVSSIILGFAFLALGQEKAKHIEQSEQVSRAKNILSVIKYFIYVIIFSLFLIIFANLPEKFSLFYPSITARVIIFLMFLALLLLFCGGFKSMFSWMSLYEEHLSKRQSRANIHNRY